MGDHGPDGSFSIHSLFGRGKKLYWTKVSFIPRLHKLVFSHIYRERSIEISILLDGLPYIIHLYASLISVFQIRYDGSQRGHCLICEKVGLRTDTTTKGGKVPGIFDGQT